MSIDENTRKLTSQLLRQLVEQNLSLFLYEPAKFFAERLYYEDPCPENLHLWSQSYFRQGKFKQTYLLLQNDSWPSNRYLFAVACMQLGKLSEAERALRPDPKAKEESVPGGAAGLYLLGCICRHEQRKQAAIDYFQQSLRVDPAMWSSVMELSEMGVAVDTSSLFGMDLVSALRVLCDQEPSVAIASSNTTAAWASDIALHPQTTTSSSSSSSSSNGGLHGNREENGHGQSHLAAVVERRRVAESLADASTFSPRVAISLGLSSVSLRVPFATPGSVPSALPNLSYGGTGTGMGGNYTHGGSGNPRGAGGGSGISPLVNGMDRSYGTPPLLKDPGFN